jgi:hypothetical protein
MIIFGQRMGMKAGFSGWDLWPYTIGVLLMAQARFIRVFLDIRDLRARIATLEQEVQPLAKQ